MSDIFSNLFPGMMGEAVKHGQAQAEAEGGLEESTPAAPVPAYPQDERGGPWSAKLPPSTDPAADALNGSVVGEQVTNHPIPLIGTVPFGGIVIDAGVITTPAGNDVVAAPPNLVTIGDNGNGRPNILGIILAPSGAAAAPADIQIVANFGALNAGYSVMNATTLPMFIPCRRLNLRVTGPVASAPASQLTVRYLVIGSDLAPST